MGFEAMHEGPVSNRFVGGVPIRGRSALARDAGRGRQVAQPEVGGRAEEGDIHFAEASISHIIHRYTREAGVRNLEREIGTICRKRARRIAEERSAAQVSQDGAQADARVPELFEVTPQVVEGFLGAPKVREEAEIAERTKKPGVAVGLAWTPAGGDVLFIEATKMRGGGKGMLLTGHLGQVMQESMQAGLSWVRANAELLKIAPTFFKKNDLHLHVPSGAVPKDGPSAGGTMATALASLFSKTPVRPDVGMTGEITLRGQVLPVGGIKEKVLAAHRAGLDTVVLPRRNKKDLDDVPDDVRKQINFVLVDHVDEVISEALMPSSISASAPKRKH